MSIFARVFRLLQGPATKDVVEDAAPIAERRQLRFETDRQAVHAAQRQIDSNVDWAHHHLDRARTTLYVHKEELDRIKDHIDKAKAALNRLPQGATDARVGLSKDPRLHQSTRDILKPLGERARQISNWETGTRQLTEAKTRLDQAREIASKNPGLKLNTEKIPAAYDRHGALKSDFDKLYSQAWLAHKDILGPTR